MVLSGGESGNFDEHAVSNLCELERALILAAPHNGNRASNQNEALVTLPAASCGMTQGALPPSGVAGPPSPPGLPLAVEACATSFWADVRQPSFPEERSSNPSFSSCKPAIESGLSGDLDTASPIGSTAPELRDLQ